MTQDATEIIRSHKSSGGFIKTSDTPLTALSSEQKVLLNRKGNMLFNDGEFEQAQRLYITTGYSDGLSRIGDIYNKNGEDLKALKFYFLAKNKAKSQPIIEKIANVVANILKEN